MNLQCSILGSKQQKSEILTSGEVGARKFVIDFDVLNYLAF